MEQVYRQVLTEKAQDLESLECKMRTYAQADRLAKQRLNEISSLLKDVVQVVIQVLDRVGPEINNNIPQNVGSV